MIPVTQCPKCSARVRMVPLDGRNAVLCLDAQPDPKGTVVMLGNRCRYLDGPWDYAAVRRHDIPRYYRHNLRCPRQYKPHPMVLEREQIKVGSWEQLLDYVRDHAVQVVPQRDSESQLGQDIR